MKPPKAGMKVSMLGSSYAYARAPLGSIDYSQGTTYANGAPAVKGIVTDGAGNVVASTGGGDSVLDWVKALGTIGTNVLDSINGSANARKAAELMKANPSTAEEKAKELDMNQLAPWLVGGAVGIVALIVLAKKL